VRAARSSQMADRAHEALAERLRRRQPELKGMIVARVIGLSNDNLAADPEYSDGLRRAVASALDHAGGAIGLDHPSNLAVPSTLLFQAALAARSGVDLEIVLRRYAAGQAILVDSLLAEAAGLLSGSSLRQLLRSQAVLFEDLLEAVSEAYRREAERRPRSPEQLRAETVKRLLAGELKEAPSLGYELNGTHVAVIAHGPGARELLRGVAVALDRHLLSVCHGETVVWA
jgi:hypothetical protein